MFDFIGMKQPRAPSGYCTRQHCSHASGSLVCHHLCSERQLRTVKPNLNCAAYKPVCCAVRDRSVQGIQREVLKRQSSLRKRNGRGREGGREGGGEEGRREEGREEGA